ncbi:MAG TPA: VWA domain-containing protein [Thermoanaerobaculia bacterium]|nr:VWA domain-containing protein [Thermoanaerobaculia bacterium]
MSVRRNPAAHVSAGCCWVLMMILQVLVCPKAAAQASHSETVSVSYVAIPFTAFDGKGKPISNLQPRDVKLLVDGQPVRTDMFERAHDAQVSFTIVVDGSGSMALMGKIDAARAAVRTLLNNRQPGDDFALYVFDDRDANQVVPFTRDVNRILAELDRVRPFGKTAFFDALSKMPERSRLGSNPSRAIILLTDGIDNASRLTRSDLARRLHGIAIPIYALGLREETIRPRKKGEKLQEELSDAELLDEIARITGGKVFIGTEPERLAGAVTELSRDLRSQYLLGFTPTGRGEVKYRRISLQVTRRARSVRVRAGYIGTEPPLAAAASSGGRKR